MKTTILFLLVMTSVWASAVTYADDIRLGDPVLGGSGCPSGTARATLSANQKALSILFDQFSAQAGGPTGLRTDRKNCDIAIPIHVPQGFSLSIIGIDYRGFNSLPAGGSSRFAVEYFFAGGRGPRFQKTFNGPMDQDFLLNNTLAATAVVWSACGADVILRTAASMQTITNFRGEQALSSVDSMDVNAGIVYQIQWRRCF